jgi:potassium-dependent mechanosensitive channel
MSETTILEHRHGTTGQTIRPVHSAPGHAQRAAGWRRTMRGLGRVWIVALLVATAPPAHAQSDTAAPPDTGPVAADPAPTVALPAPPPPLSPELEAILLDQVQQPAAHLRTAIDALEKDVEIAKDSDTGLSLQRVEIDALLSGSDLFLESLQPRYQAINAQIQRLGPLPGKDGPAEAKPITTERLRLNALSAEIDGAVKSTGLVQYRARELLSRVQEYRAAIFTTQLFRRTDSPLSPSTWADVANELPKASTELHWIAWRWWRSAKESWLSLTGVLAGAFLIYLVLALLRGRFLSGRLPQTGDAVPSYFERSATAGWVAPVFAAPAAAAATAVAIGLDSMGLTFLGTDRLAVTALPAILVLIAVAALARAILQPSRARWRLVNLADAPARDLTRVVTWIGAIYAADFILKEIIRILALPLPVSVVEAFLASVLLAALLLKIVRTRFVPQYFTPPADAETGVADATAQDPSAMSRLTPRLLKLPLLAVAGFILATSVLGYVALGRFVAGQVIVTSSAIVLVILLHLAIRALAGQDSSASKALGHVMHDRLGLDAQQGRTISRATVLILNAGLALLALPLILLTWGFTLPDTLAWLKALIFGFEVGQIRISLAQIAIAIALFVGLLAVTRLVQRWLSSTVLMPPRVDQGIANSIHTGVGYAGFALAVLVAMSYGGLDITNLAIVAGALSVGIGFGLQSIVNNFVSGLILLVERPVKVGDLVSVNGHAGRVRNIAVRSTEIETGDKASLIVPNSELITSTVTNWTHRNALARVNIKVGASYKSDPEHVREVLQKLAADCPLVLQQPRPDVSFDNFGPNGFEFSLSAVVADVGKGGSAQTDLRMRIVRAFRAAAIEMPNAQHDVHLRDLDMLRDALNRIAQERARAADKTVDATDLQKARASAKPKPV